MSLENEKQLKTKKIMSLMSLYPIKTVVKISVNYIASEKRLIRLIRLINGFCLLNPPGNTALRTTAPILSTCGLEPFTNRAREGRIAQVRGLAGGVQRAAWTLSESDISLAKKGVPEGSAQRDRSPNAPS